MKTIHSSKCIVHSWLCKVVLLLAFFNFQLSITNSVKAQQENAAFYIYQNDGHFDGFFYDEVEKISYSKLDTAGVEHDDYVSQEIITADSVYRFMLTAIDSVSFVQPEIKFNPQLRMMDDVGLTDYIVRADGALLILRGDTPEQLRPQEGQVLACPKLPVTGAPFVGKVFMTYELSDNLYVLCNKISSLGEVFEQFISLEEIVTDETGAQVRRRLAGMKSNPEDGNSRRAEANWNADLFQFNVDMEDSWELKDKWKFLLNFHGGFGMKAQVVYNISPVKFFLKMKLEERVEIGMRASIDGTLGDMDNALEKGLLFKTLTKLSRIHLPVNLPVIYLDGAPKPFVRGDAHFNIGLNVGTSSKLFQQWFLISTEPPYFDCDLLARNLDEWISPSASVTAELNGMLQMGMKLPFVIGTEDYFGDLLEVNVGNKIYVGPKLTASLSLDVLKALTGKGVYESFKDTKLTFYPFCYDNEIAFEGKFFFGNPKERKYTFNKSMGTVELGAFPEFSDVTCEVTGDNQRTINAKLNLNGEVFAPQSIGFGLYDKEGKLVDYKERNELYLINTFNEVDVSFTNVEPGNYIVRPITRLFRAFDVPIYGEEQKVSIDALQIKAVPSAVTFEAEGGTEIITIEDGMGGPLYCSITEDWIHPTVSGLYSVVEIKVDPNETKNYREGKLVVYQKINDTESLSDTIYIKQYSNGISISKTELEFTEKGGTEVLDVMTSLTGLTVNITDNTDKTNWLHAELEGAALVVRASAADEGQSRSATVVLSAFNREGNGIFSTKLKVTQKALFEVEEDTILLGAKDAGYLLHVTTSLPEVKASVNKNWLDVYPVEWNDPNVSGTHIFGIGADDNYGGKPRQAKLILSFPDNSQTVQKTIIVIQDNKKRLYPFIEVEETEVELKPEGDTQEVEVQTNMDVIDVAFDNKEKDKWCSAYIKETEDGYACVIAAGANNTSVLRECWITLSVSDGNDTESQRIRVIQGPVVRLIQYDGISACVRWGGTLNDDFFSDKTVTSRNFPPIVYGVYGRGTEPSVNPAFTSVPDIPGWHGMSLGNTTAHFQKVDGCIWGSFTWDYGTEYLSFSIIGAPCKQGGPKQSGSYSSTYWWGDAAICVDGEYIGSYVHWKETRVEGTDDEWIRTYDEGLPSEIDVYFHIADPNNNKDTLPWGHPDRNNY